LGHVQRLGGAAEAAFAGDGMKGAELNRAHENS